MVAAAGPTARRRRAAYGLGMAEPSRLADVATLLPDRVEQHYGADRRVDELRAAVLPFAGDARPVGVQSLRDLESSARAVFRHIELTHTTGLLPQERSPGWPPVDPATVRAEGAGIAAARLEPGGAAVLELTGLAPIAGAASLLTGAFELVRHAERLDIDLRANGGGDPATLALIVDWVAGWPPRHLFDVRYRDRTRQWWTAGAPPAPPPAGRVRALIGPDTYSSAEALAWVLQRQGLATLAGAPTRGAADHVVPLNLTHDVYARIPEAAVVAPGGGPTWEGVGVQPDEGLAPDAPGVVRS